MEIEIGYFRLRYYETSPDIGVCPLAFEFATTKWENLIF